MSSLGPTRARCLSSVFCCPPRFCYCCCHGNGLFVGVYVCLNTGWLVIAAAVPNNSYKHEDACCNYVSVCVLYACLQTVSTILWWVLLHSPALVFPLGGVANIQTPPSAPSDPLSTPPLIVPECSRGKRS